MIVLKATAGVRALGFSPDGSLLVAAQSGQMRAWAWPPDGAKPRVLAELNAWAVEFTPDGRRVLAEGPDGVGLADLTTRTVATLRSEPPAKVNNTGGLIAPGGLLVVAGELIPYPNRDYWLTAWAADRPGAALWQRPASDWAYPVAFPNADTVTAAERDAGGAAVFVTRRLANGDVVATRPMRGGPGSLAATSADRSLLVLRRNTELTIHRTADFGAGPVVLTSPAGRRGFTAAAFHPSGDFLVATTSASTVTAYDTRAWQVTRTFDWGVGKLRAVAFSPDGTVCAVAGDGGKVVCWDFDA